MGTSAEEGMCEQEKSKRLNGNSIQEDGGDSKANVEGMFLILPDEIDALPSKLRYNNFDLLCTIISILTYLFDLVMDCVVAIYFYHLGVSHGIYHYWYFGLTITFVLIPSLTMTGFSLRWYLMDAENSQLPPVPLWKWALRLILLILQIAPVLRYVDSMKFGILSRRAGAKEDKATDVLEKRKAREKRIKYYTLMVYEDADATLLRLFECFMESAPQLVLQIYILIRDPLSIKLNEQRLIGATSKEADVIIKSTILVVSVVSSLVSLAWSLVVYHRSLRYTYPEKNNLNWSGSVMQFLWHFLSITARVIALSLFASIYPKWIGPACIAHWLIMSTWVVSQRTQACNTKCEEVLFCLVLGAIYVFSFFNAKEERTRYKYLIYYSFCFCENTILLVFWFLFANQDVPPGHTHWYYYPGIIIHYLAFFGGIFFMLVYYAYFHPTGIVIHLPFKLGLRRPAQKPGGPDQEHLSGEQHHTHLTDLAAHQELEPGRPQAGLSVSASSPVLDEPDSPIVAAGERKYSVRRTASAPSRAAVYASLLPTRSFKVMARARFYSAAER